MTNKPVVGIVLRTALLVSGVFAPFARTHLKRRLAKGKEDPKRWREKLGETDAARPDGPLVWLHGVGVGEVMALRGLIDTMSRARPDLNFLVTSSARSSGAVIAQNLPARTQHQYLPLDLRGPVGAFLDHWRPDLVVWSDQEVWPRLAVTVARRGVPQTYVAARITRKSAKAKARFGDGYGNLYRLLDLRHAQDTRTADTMRMLMGDGSDVVVSGSLKPAAAALADDPPAREAVMQASGRAAWLVASAHDADIDIALDAHVLAQSHLDVDRLLIIAPRDLATAQSIVAACEKRGLTCAVRSKGALPDEDTDVYIADTFGELGLWYRICFAALIGGTFDETQGHNPWEAVALRCSVMHGPRIENFASDFKALDAANGALKAHTAEDIARAINEPDTLDLAQNATSVHQAAALGLGRISDDLLDLLAR